MNCSFGALRLARCTSPPPTIVMLLRHRIAVLAAATFSSILHAQTWSTQRLESADVGQPRSIAYGDGHFVLSFTPRASASLAYSTDGTEWSFATGANFSPGGTVLFHNHTFYYASGNGSYRSDDGTAWSKTGTIPGGPYASTEGLATDGITFLFGSNSSNQPAPLYTLDFETWTYAAEPPTTESYPVVRGYTPVFGLGRMVLNYAAYRADQSGFTDQVATSIDAGESWTANPTSISGSRTMVFGNGRFLYLTANRIFESTDGINFTVHTDLGGLPGSTNHLFFAGGRFVALVGSEFYASVDGLNWSAFGSLPTALANPTVLVLAYGNGRYLGVMRKLNFDTFEQEVTTLTAEAPGAPVITQHPVSATASLGDSVQFNVELDDDTGCTFAWFKDGTPVSDAGAATLNRSPVTTDDDGEYHVVVTNATGSTQSYAAILVVRRPHSADYNGDYALDLSELLRAIELYNTRNGTTRTGHYRIATETSVDGFDADPDTAPDATPALEHYHAADIDRNAAIDLSELLRLIELYNTREGTARTGRYHHDPTAIDGYAGGPAS